MLKKKAVKELQKIIDKLIYKTFNLPKKGRKEQVIRLFGSLNAENMIFRNFLRNIDLWGDRFLK